MGQADTMEVEVRGYAGGHFEVSEDKKFSKISATIPLKPDGNTAKYKAPFTMDAGVRPLFFRYKGTGAVDFLSFTLSSEEDNKCGF